MRCWLTVEVYNMGIITFFQSECVQYNQDSPSNVLEICFKTHVNPDIIRFNIVNCTIRQQHKSVLLVQSRTQTAQLAAVGSAAVPRGHDKSSDPGLAQLASPGQSMVSSTLKISLV